MVLPHIDTLEYGAEIEGTRQSLDRRLFMQLLVLRMRDPRGSAHLEKELRRVLPRGVVYQDLNDPQSVGLLTWSEDPSFFVDELRSFLQPFIFGRELTLREELTMLGRTYGSGHERDLAHWILERPIENATAPTSNWAIWYPLRRKGSFEQLEGRDKGAVLAEHAHLGRAYGAQGLATDIRLRCHGLDQSDNEFVIGLMGEKLHPLSHVIETMRSTRQTAEFVEKMGPFFVGRRILARR